VTELWRYPVKSLAGERRGAVTLDVPLVELAAEAVVLDHARSRDAVRGSADWASVAGWRTKSESLRAGSGFAMQNASRRAVARAQRFGSPPSTTLRSA
jgi:hypothetical protein